MPALLMSINGRGPQEAVYHSARHIGGTPECVLLPLVLCPCTMAEEAASREPGAQAIGNVQQELNGAMDVMRDNMQMMVERDTKINDLDARSAELQNTSGAFKQQAGQLRKHQEWQQRKVYLVTAGLVLSLVWVLMLIIFKKHWAAYIGVSLALFSVSGVSAFLYYRSRQAHSDGLAHYASAGEPDLM